MSCESIRDVVLETALRSLELGLTHGTSGNVSVRSGDGLAITPTGLVYQDLEPDDIVMMDLEGAVRPDERRRPSSEWRMHAVIYRERSDVNAIVHGHSPAATAVACLGRGIPAFHYMIAQAGGDSIRCAPYAPFGTEELAKLAVDALVGRKACLLAHHGLVAVGADPAEALAVGSETEFLADLLLRLLPLGEPRSLDSAAMTDVLERFSRYGRRDSSPG